MADKVKPFERSKETKVSGAALGQSGRKFGRTSDGVTIYKPAAGANNFTAKELRAAVHEARNAK